MNRQNHEVYRTENTGSGKSIFTGFLIGGLLGAGTMLLLAPKSGRETREEIKLKAQELRDRTEATVKDTVTQARSKAQQITAEARGKADELQQKGKDLAVEQLDRIASAAESGKKALKNSS